MIRSSDQITLTDITDAYSVMLTSEAHAFPGTATSAVNGSSTTTQVIALQGATQIPVTINVSEIEKPTGVMVSKDTSTTAPTLTITVSSEVTEGGAVKIPVHIGSDITIYKQFTFAISFSGTNGTSVKVSSTSVTYAKGANGTTAPDSGWQTSIPAISNGEYLWTKTVVTYSDGNSTTAFSVSRQGTDGSSVGVSSTSVTYASSSNGNTPPESGWGTTIPAVAAGGYLWTKTVVNYDDGNSTTSFSVSRNGTNGADGADAVTISITSSNGTIFKNTSIATTLTAHVYKGGKELTASEIAQLGVIKWYKDGETTTTKTGQTLTIDADQVNNKAIFVAQLEGDN